MFLARGSLSRMVWVRWVCLHALVLKACAGSWGPDQEDAAAAAFSSLLLVPLIYFLFRHLSVMACADSALLFLMDEAGVSSDTQKKIYQGGFDTLISFAGLDETSAGVRAALKQFGLDVETSLAIRKEVALLVGVWESAKTQRAMQVKQKLDANASGPARLIQTTEYAAMRSAVEATQGSLRDKEAPSKSLVASKLEQLEDGAPVAEDLREATSFEDSAVEAYSAVVDPGSNFLRIRPGKSTTTPPSNPEELRLRHRRLGLAWAFVKSRHANRAWINASIVDDFRKLSDHVLGSTVAGLRTSAGVGPSWSLALL